VGSGNSFTTTRWEVTEIGAVLGDSFCSTVGTYDVGFSDVDCGTLEFTLVSDDNCDERNTFLTSSFVLTTRDNLGDCVEEGTLLTTQLGESVNAPSLSMNDATVVFGMDRYAIVSVSDRSIIYQRWTLSNTDNNANGGETTTIVDIGATGDSSFTCALWSEGVYLSNWDADCSAQLCGITDSCLSRGELFHATSFNGFEPIDGCVENVMFPTLVGRGNCNPNADTWEKHPWDCVDQDIQGGCMFCLGRANNVEVRQCLDRNGGGCNQIFNTIAAKAFCTLEFECPASTISFSITVFISCLVALLLR